MQGSQSWICPYTARYFDTVSYFLCFCRWCRNHWIYLANKWIVSVLPLIIHQIWNWSKALAPNKLNLFMIIWCDRQRKNIGDVRVVCVRLERFTWDYLLTYFVINFSKHLLWDECGKVRSLLSCTSDQLSIP